MEGSQRGGAAAELRHNDLDFGHWSLERLEPCTGDEVEHVSKAPEGKNLVLACGKRLSCQVDAQHGVVGIVRYQAGDLSLDSKISGYLEDPVAQVSPSVADRHVFERDGEALQHPVCRDKMRSNDDV